jgi:hypothetical protein
MGIFLFLYTLGSVGYIIFLFIGGSTNFFSILKTFGLLSAVWIVLFIIWFIKSSLYESKKHNSLREHYKKQYEEALKGTNKQKAIEYGRLYYNHIKSDEAANEIKISNDISCMKI